MENKILIALAIFSMSILITQVYINNANAVTFTIKSLGSTIPSASQWNNCEYISTTQVWCPSGTGIKVWNPTTQVLTTTIESGNSFNDIKCGSTYCYLWDIISTTTANLTKYQISGFVRINETQFSGNAGFVVGHGIGLVSVSDGVIASNVLLLPVEGQNCLGTTDHKGVCIFDGATFEALRFISSGSTNDLERVHDIEWNGELASVGEPTANRALVKYNNLAGTFLWQLINLADGDTTFATTRICETASLTGTVQQSKMVIIDGKLFDAYSSADMLVMDTTLDTCAVAVKTNLVDETSVRTTTYDSTEDLFIVSATNLDGGIEESGIYIFNGTTFDTITTTWQKVLKVNTTQTTTPLWTHFNHQSEGEIQVWIGSNILIIGDILTATGGETPTEEFCLLPENANILICRLEDSPPLTGTSELLNQSSTNIVCMIGLIECNQDEDGNFIPVNGDIKTNGVGYLLTIIAFGILISIFWLASGGRLGDIPTFVWFISTLALLGVMVGFDFLDVTFLLIGIIAVIALAVARIKGLFGDAGLFKGE